MDRDSRQFYSMRWILFWVFLVLFIAIVISTILVVFANIGSPTQDERSKLFNIFMIEVGAAIITLFYAVFRISKSRERQSCITHELTDDTNTDKSHHLLTQIKSAGVTNFIPTRNHYAIARPKAPTIDAYIDTAKHEVIIVSINLMTGLPFHGLCNVLKRRLEDQSNSFKVTISLLNPARKDLMTAMAASVGPTRLAQSIADTLKELVDFRNGLPSFAQKCLLLRVHSVIPFASAILLDSDEEYGRIQIETKPYKAPIQKSFAIEFRNTGEDTLYETLRDSYRRIIKDSKDVALVLKEPIVNMKESN